MPVPPVPVGDVVLAVRTQVGQWYAGQQVVGSTPSLIGVAPSGHAIAIAGQATGLFGSHVVVLGTHLPTQVWPRQVPVASQVQVGSAVVQPQVEGGGTVLFAVIVVGVPPALQPHFAQSTEQAWPLGQSVSTWQPVWMFGTQTPKQSVGVGGH